MFEEIYTTAQAKLKKMRASGKTNQEIADLAGMSQSHINRLLNEDSNVFAKLNLEAVLRLGLLSDCTAINNHHNTNTNINCQGTGAASAIDEVLNSDEICDKCKVAVLKILRRK